jgi:hypothetical protein
VCAVGAFYDDDVNRIIDLDGEKRRHLYGHGRIPLSAESRVTGKE